MAVDRTPVLKRCKALGISPMVMGYGKETKRNRNANQRKKVSEYGLQLKEKQKLKFIYGVLEKQFYHYYEMAVKEEGIAGHNLLRLLESRIDNVVFRAGFAITRREARQLVGHGHFTVNGKKVDIPSYRLKAGQTIALKETSKNLAVVKAALEAKVIRADYLAFDADKQVGTLVRLPERSEFLPEINEQQIVEFYNRG